jgi:sulfite exporter TauE/SafE
MTALLLGLAAALAAGFAGSAHCAAMCGGIAAAAGGSFRRDAQLPVGPALAFNVARLASYALVGAVLAGGFGALAGALPLPQVARALRLFAGLVLVALALRLLTGRDWLGAERLGSLAWARLRRLLRRVPSLPAALRPAALGALWGFMPCGLVYSVLLVAAATGRPLAAAASMLAFGIGTLPSMLAMTLGAAPASAWLRRPGMRRAAGSAILGCAAWTLAMALATGAHVH